MSKFSIEKLFSDSAQKIVGQIFGVSQNSGIEKFFASEGYVLNPSMLCFRKFPVAKSLSIGRRERRFSVENFLSHSDENIRERTL